MCVCMCAHACVCMCMRDVSGRCDFLYVCVRTGTCVGGE